MNRYDELAPVREDVAKYILPHVKLGTMPVKTYDGEFEKTPIWVYWHQGLGKAPEIVKLCVASIRANIPKNCQLIFLDKYNMNDYTVLPDYVVKKTGANYTHSSNMLRAALLYLYGGMWIDATFLLKGEIPQYCFEGEFWALKNFLQNPDDPIEYIEDFAMECMRANPGNEMLLYIYQMLCTYWFYNDKLYHYFLKDGIINYGYENNKFPRKYIDDLAYSNPDRYAFNATRINGMYTAQEYDYRVANTDFFKETYKFGIKYLDEIHGKPTFYKHFKFRYLKDETCGFTGEKQKYYCEELKQLNIKPEILVFPQEKNMSFKSNKIPVWTFWYQGEENAPDSVKCCFESMRRFLNKNDFELIVLDKENLSNYLELPQKVLDRVGTNYTHLSLFIRFALLYLYGGVWVDSTFLMTDSFLTKEFLEDKPFWSYVWNENNVNSFYINICYAKPKNDICLFLYRTLCAYWEKMPYLIWYHIIMSMIQLGYEENYFDKKQLDALVNNGKPTNMLYGVNINKIFTKNELDKMNEKCFIHKLTYKQEPFYKDYNDSKLTFYGFLRKIYLKKN